MNKMQAINYLKSSGFSDEQIITLVNAFADIRGDYDELQFNLKLVELALDAKRADCESARVIVRMDDIEFTCDMNFSIRQVDDD